VDEPGDNLPRDPAAAAGSRRRRRALYGPPPRLTATSPLSGRLVWHIGDWGRASEHIGGRWEEVAGTLAREHLGGGDALVLLASRPELMAQVLASGLPHADAVRAWRDDGHLALEPLDFKWSLTTASTSQVSAETLARLLEEDLPELRGELATVRARLDLDPEYPLEPRDGRFVAPEHPANDVALRLDPELPSLLLPVDAQAFFRALPAWDTAVALARFEGCDVGRLRGVEAVERYYRLGAGIAGAYARLRTGLFEEVPRVPVDAPAIVDTARASRAATSLNGLLLDLERQLAARKALEERLAQLPRAAYTFGQFRADLLQAGAPRSVLDRRGALGRAYGGVIHEVLLAVRAEGRALTEAGSSQTEALDRLGSDPERWVALARASAGRAARSIRAPA